MQAVLAGSVLFGASAYAADTASGPASAPAPAPAAAPVARAGDAAEAQLARGAYLTKAADCIACHTANKAHPFAGGVPFATPFGTVYSTNITPDVQKGIGSFSDQDFIRAVREGVSKGGKRLYPAMPYTSYTQLSDDDILAIRAYLKTVTPIDIAPPANTMPFPFNQRWAMMFWNMSNFNSGRFHPDSTKSAEWNRGAYLVTALGHCQECHTPRNFLGGMRSSMAYAGHRGGAGSGGRDDALIPNITPDRTGIGAWSAGDLEELLASGTTPDGDSVGGDMGEVVREGTSRMTPADRRALVGYLRSLRPVENQLRRPGS